MEYKNNIKHLFLTGYQQIVNNLLITFSLKTAVFIFYKILN